MIISPVLKQTPLLLHGGRFSWRRTILPRGNVFWIVRQWPLDSSGIIDQLVIANAGDFAGLTTREFFQNVKHGFRRRPFLEHLPAAPVLGDKFENVEIR